MADAKITDLTTGNPAQSGDELPINRAGADRKVTAGSIAALATVADGDKGDLVVSSSGTVWTLDTVAVSKGGTGQTTEAEAVGELIQALSADSSPDYLTDYIATYDASADTGKKVLLGTAIRERVSSDRTYYVRKDGSDSNTGLADNSGGAFLTITKAVDTVMGLDLGGDTATDIYIQVRNGTYDEKISLGSLVGFHGGKEGTSLSYTFVYLVGDEATPSNVVLTNTTGSFPNVIECTGGAAQWNVAGFRITPKVDTTCWGAIANAGAHLLLTDVDFHSSNTANSCFAISANDGAVVKVGGTVRFAGKWAKMLESEYQSRIDFQCTDLTFSSADFSTLLYCDENSSLYFYYSGTLTGAPTSSTKLYSAHDSFITQNSSAPGTGATLQELVGFVSRSVGGLYTFKDEADCKLLEFVPDATPINYIEVGSGDTGVDPYIKATGSGSDAHLSLQGKGGGLIVLQPGSQGVVQHKPISSGNIPTYVFWTDPLNSFTNEQWEGFGIGSFEWHLGTGEVTFGEIICNVIDGTGATEDGEVCLVPTVGGSQVSECNVSNGVLIGTSGNYPGTGGLRLAHIELGHDSDTTLARAAAGALTVEGVRVSMCGKQTIWVPAASMTPRTTSGAEATTRETNGITASLLAFDTAADEGANFHVAFPKSWNAGTVTYQAFWTAASSTGTVEFELRGGCFADDAAINTSGLGTAVAVSDTLLATNDVHVTSESSAVTLSNAADDTLAFFEIIRDVSDDTLGADAELIGIKFFYTTDAGNDA
jgi:hypothetical protein